MKHNYSARWGMRGIITLIASSALSLSGLLRAADLASLKTQAAGFTINDKGSLTAITRLSDGRNYLPAGQPAPILQLRLSGQTHAPDSAGWDAAAQKLTLRYAAVGGEAEIKVIANPTHVSLELRAYKSMGRIEAVQWGPYPTTIGDIIGEVVGVARDPEFAIGIQALNPKTLGGVLGEENDIEPGGGHDDPGKYADLSSGLNKDQLYRGNTAWPTAFGSVLQAFCRDRSEDRIVSNWGHDRYLAPAFRDGGVIGSKIALFACPAPQALATIGQIEVAEGLPHPMLNGIWGKLAPDANASYLIMDFSESTIDQAIDATQRAGLSSLYHSGPFETWGHFKLKPRQFPHGWDGLRICSDKARAAGITLGFHTLSNFITPNDPYVTPKPDSRLARIGASPLAAEVDATTKDILVENPEYFQKKTALNTVVIGDELVRYEAVSAAAPWRLLGCQRGAWGTQPAAHQRGAAVGKLMDHDYKVFLTNAELSMEMAGTIAKLCNHADVRKISMDGLEGNWSTGHGQYGRVLFAKAWYDALAPELRGGVRNDASNPAHFNWHINTYYNWGEPWYGGFRQSQTLYRFKNQMFYERNLLPRMLGWFSLQANTSLADTEWLLAHAAGYNAGFALATSPEYTGNQVAAAAPTGRNKEMAAILEAIKQWETARLAGAFPTAVRTRLRDSGTEFHLEAAGKSQWNLYPVENGQRGEPVRLTGKP